MAERARTPAPVVVGEFDDLLEPAVVRVLQASPALEVIATRVSADALPGVIAAVTPTVAVVELGRVSAQLLKRLAIAQRSTAFVALAPRPTRAERLEVAAAGAELLSTAAQRRDVESLVHLVARRGPAPQASRLALDVLTPAEVRVYKLLGDDVSNGEIARSLGIGTETVRTHVKRILRKLGARTRKDLLIVEG